jgi:hypothetical protein
MTFRKSILLLIGLSMVAALVACSSSSHTTPPSAITVTVGAVPASVATNSVTATISATTNDTAGVTWSCSPAPCGTFNPTNTLTGANTGWTAPNVLSAGVTLTATSVTNPSISNSSAAIPVTAATLADGTYVFSLAGEDANSNYYVAGEITIAGGLITAGEQDFNDVVHDRFDQINGTVNGSGASTITTTADGNLQLSLLTCLATPCTAANFDPVIGPGGNGTETLNGVILPLSTTGRTFITEYDTSASASGELDQQDLSGAGSTTPANGYAFVLNGYDPGGTADPEAVGGIINIDDVGGVLGSISGTGSTLDVNDGGTPSPGQTFAASTVSAPDALGRVIFTLNTSIFSQVLLAGYIVDSSHIRLVETHDTYSGCLGGVAYSQGANTGTFTAASAAGIYVVGVQGFDTNGVLQAVSQLSLGAGVTGFVDYNDLVTSSGITATSPDPVTAAGYTVDGAGAGDITIPAVTDTTATVSYNVQLYLDGNGHALAITMDTNDIVAGAGYTQGTGVTTTSFNGAYGLDVTGDDGSNENELDGVGPVNVTSGAIAGTVDLNWLFNPSPGPTYPATAVNGTTVTTGAGASTGIFTGTITGVDVVACFTNGSCSNDAFSYYLIDSAGDNIAIETDENQLTLGFFLQQ